MDKLSKHPLEEDTSASALQERYNYYDEVEMTTEDESEAKKAAAEIHEDVGPPPILPVIATGSFVALLAAMTVFAGPMTDYLRATTAQLMSPQPYISTVLGTPGKEIKTEEEAH